MGGVEHVRNTAAHTSSEVATSSAQNDNATASHVLTAVITDTLNNGSCTGVADGETLSGNTRELSTELSNMGWMFMNPELRRVRGEDPDLAFLICCAAQRQICSGREEDLWEVLGLTFKHVK